MSVVLQFAFLVVFFLFGEIKFYCYRKSSIVSKQTEWEIVKEGVAHISGSLGFYHLGFLFLDNREPTQ